MSVGVWGKVGLLRVGVMFKVGSCDTVIFIFIFCFWREELGRVERGYLSLEWSF